MSENPYPRVLAHANEMLDRFVDVTAARIVRRHPLVGTPMSRWAAWKLAPGIDHWIGIAWNSYRPAEGYPTLADGSCAHCGEPLDEHSEEERRGCREAMEAVS